MSSTTAIHDLLAEHAAAHAARNPERLIALYWPEPVMYTLAPPLQQGSDTEYGTAEGLRRWYATFDGPVHVEYRDPVVTASGDVAFVHTLTRMTATPTGAPEPFSFWFRSTFGLRERDGAWRIVHLHESTPFYMDGSFRSAVDLQP
ncbi:MAG: SgcJ/EcaC family oxidoreductase [Actinobacteria bacterium]|nr:SgcJ/EcaC family oxidoreductase [Actinomycetota bacterium]